ncbi:transport protein (probable substrate zinc/cadmium/cobalt) [Natronomonas pharaonis DSM 2160]|uniref:Transport protein (Probable substrate zinc/cadmium/cobalt) n=1 Tax=Natronomonas pharaonis (strain ATCC 35678 / DSM 2160 / CIP 103997 / JCM 8858 / NBRC 14720 / NCIMB 2260 / Gabara) TaxID=348780 RepID=A0A1U7EX45_NATPD|nr:cation diffusion facilitator family transporter [Natronomonas pharaonis]CAI49689.1 transport protein (probable substrate zinc/cadmium/cobalt) [Natronomonas pharaonis DSM 2160]
MRTTAAEEAGLETETARRRFSRASLVNVAGNAVKILVEGAVGLAFGSVALLADAAHSVADLVASAVVLVWGRSVYTDPDENHPHGHQRVEPLAALFVGSLIVLLGLNLFYESATGLVAGPEVQFHPLLVGALLFAMADMYLLYWYTTHINESVGSSALEALAIDCRNDIYTTIAALCGVIGVFFGYPLFDAVAGGLVSVLVVYQGFEISRENVSYLVGASPSDQQRQRVVETLTDHPAVHGAHDVAVFYDGTDIEVEAHVEVDGELTLVEAHDIETELVSALRSLESVGDVHLHLDPAGIGEWKDAAVNEQRGPETQTGSPKQ